jgi:hypothetical protein
VTDTASCSVCGTSVQGEPPLTWSTSTGPRGRTLVTSVRPRDHVRAIEAKLDEEWW